MARPARGGVSVVRWPWQRPAVEHRSSYTDAVVTAILQSASGGGVRPALATAALEAVATLYASALASCEVSGPKSITRALDASWRASVASSLVRHGQALYLIDADPSAGLALAPVSHWDVHGGPERATWLYRCELAGPSSTAWRTRSAGAVLHLRWLIDNARPWAGVSPLSHAADTGSLAGWLDKRLSEEASGPVGSFLPVAKYDADPDADLDADADDPLAQLRRDIGSARGSVLAVESQMASADSPASAPRKDYQVARFGANPPRDLVELRANVGRDIGAACGVPRALLDSTASGQASREAWRQFISTSVDGLCRRLEAQILDQVGVAVSFDTSPLGGRDLLARASVFRRLKEAGMSVDDARRAAGI